MPYETAADAVEFWREVDELFKIDRPLCPNQNTIVDWPPNEQGYGVESYTRDRLARCVLWLAERGYSIERITISNTDRPWFCRLDDPAEPNAGFDIDNAVDDIITAHRDAVLAVAREAK